MHDKTDFRSRIHNQTRKLNFCKALGCSFEEYNQTIKKMYRDEKMSCKEISDRLFDISGIRISERSLQRKMKSLGVMRNIKESFNIAIKKGRVQWKYKDPLFKTNKSSIAKSLRYEILKRDGFKCVLCGRGASETILEVDHILPKCKGGLTKQDNLRALCVDCNQGKRILEKEV